MMPRVKKQHYVPRFLLQHFAQNGRLFVFDKRTNRKWNVHYTSAGHEAFFNEAITSEGVILSAERSLSSLEAKAAPLIKSLLEGKSTSWISEDDFSLLCWFVAHQAVRVPRTLKLMTELQDQLKKILSDAPHSEQVAEQLKEMTPEAAKLGSLTQLVRSPPSIAAHLSSKQSVTLQAAPGTSFLIGDSPVALHNCVSMEPYGNLGFAVRGIEVYLPISQSITLAFICPELSQRAFAGSQRFRDALEKGVPIVQTEQEMRFINSRQVFSAERYLFSGVDDFALVEEMLEKNPETTDGLRLMVN